MSDPALPLWADITIAVLVLSGALVALLGSIGLLRLRTFFERVHAPAIIATLGCWCILYGALLYFSLRGNGLALHVLLIALFIAVTVPITTIFLMRASLFRARQMGKDVPPSVSTPADGSSNINR
ncbi:MAG: monovalent cation/H(+) antiporter subunit G [Simplicispira sp.]|nr:monovalent cation/H(+) antiporter subunit G [Simplicispira sp.]